MFPVTIGSEHPFGVASGAGDVIHRHKLAIPKMFANCLSFLIYASSILRYSVPTLDSTILPSMNWL